MTGRYAGTRYEKEEYLNETLTYALDNAGVTLEDSHYFLEGNVCMVVVQGRLTEEQIESVMEYSMFERLPFATGKTTVLAVGELMLTSFAFLVFPDEELENEA